MMQALGQEVESGYIRGLGNAVLQPAVRNPTVLAQTRHWASYDVVHADSDDF